MVLDLELDGANQRPLPGATSSVHRFTSPLSMNLTEKLKPTLSDGARSSLPAESIRELGSAVIFHGCQYPAVPAPLTGPRLHADPPRP